MVDKERAELIDHINRCHSLLSVTKDPVHQRTLGDLLSYLALKLAALKENCLTAQENESG